ncbi:MAG: glycosyltransferase family 2 protein [Vibrio sp.]|uniref:glycosyltransferase family 2 protein n=1 Tax=Vibrio sp. TaxID=678 RepID=UPI003A851A21
MALFVSVINHNHDDMICTNSTLKELATEHTVLLKSNTQATSKLQDYCKDNGIILIQGKERKGFGTNNNEVFHYAEQHLELSQNDYFLVLNPDVDVSLESINQLLDTVKTNDYTTSTINLFKNRELTEYDNSIRRFPSIWNPIKSLLKIKRTDHYDKNEINEPTTVDWAAGSFLLFKYDVYKQLNGFDEKYFMYFEDVDICKRIIRNNYHLYYIPLIKGIHLAQHKNRSLFSLEVFYYLNSYLKYYSSNKFR